MAKRDIIEIEGKVVLLPQAYMEPSIVVQGKTRTSYLVDKLKVVDGKFVKITIELVER